MAEGAFDPAPADARAVEGAATPGAPLPPLGYGASLLRSGAALVVVALLAWVVLRWVAAIAPRGWRGGALGGAGRTRRLEVLERVALDARSALWLVRVDRRELLVGTGGDGAPVVLPLGDPPLEPAMAAAPPAPEPEPHAAHDRWPGPRGDLHSGADDAG